MARRGFYLALFTFPALATILTATLPARAETSAAQQHRDVEVDLGVLDEIRSYDPPQALPPPSPSQPASLNTDTPFLTAPESESIPEKLKPEPERTHSPLLPPETSPIASPAAIPATAPSTLSWSEHVPKPARKPYIGRTIEQPGPEMTVKTDLRPQPEELVQPASEVSSPPPPLPPRRPAKVNAPESFVREARENYAIEQLKPVKPIPVEEAPLETQPTPELIRAEDSPVDPLEATLIEQTPRDVLASIDPDAHLPPSGPPSQPQVIKTADPVLLGYKPGVTQLPEKIQTLLHERILLPLQKSEDMGLEITAYASVIDDRQNSDRRIALERALAVRDFFMTKGIAQERLHIRALGKETDIEPFDRVEIILSPPTALEP